MELFDRYILQPEQKVNLVTQSGKANLDISVALGPT
jgi:hypothetical protein